MCVEAFYTVFTLIQTVLFQMLNHNPKPQFCVCIILSRSTNPLHQRQTPHQQPALVTNPPHLQAWCLPPPRPRATPPCPRPPPCTTPPATVAYPPISVNGMCRTELRWSHTHSFHSTGPSSRRLGHTRGTQTNISLFYNFFLIHQGR